MEEKFKRVFKNDNDDVFSVRSINTDVTGGIKKLDPPKKRSPSPVPRKESRVENKYKPPMKKIDEYNPETSIKFPSELD